MKIVWTEPAIRDLQSIREYIGKDSEYYATRFVEKILSSVGNLSEFPLMGRKVPEAEESTIREIIFQNYRIMYQHKENVILILTIIHGSMSIETMSVKPWNIL